MGLQVTSGGGGGVTLSLGRIFSHSPKRWHHRTDVAYERAAIGPDYSAQARRLRQGHD